MKTEWIVYSFFVAVAILFSWWFSKRTSKQQPLDTAVVGPSKITPVPLPDVPSGCESSRNTADGCAEGTFFIDSFGRACCKVGDSVIVLESLPKISDLSSYLTRVYPLAIWSSSDRQPFFDNLQFVYNPQPFSIPLYKNGPVNVNVTGKKFTRARFVEVLPTNFSPPTLNPVDVFTGSLYWMVTGSGWFAEVGTSLCAYNVCHALSLLGASPEKILAVASPSFRLKIQEIQAQTNNNTSSMCVQPTAAELGEAVCDKKYGGLVNAQIDPLTLFTMISSCWVKNTSFGIGIEKSQKLLAELASLRGFDSVQILNEPDSTCPCLVLFTCEPIYHNKLLSRKCPLSGFETNPLNARMIYLGAYLQTNVPQVEEAFYDSPSKIEDDVLEWQYKTKCRAEKGVLNIVDVLTTCRQIVTFGSPFLVFSDEIASFDWSLLPQTNELEKLQSYFYAVYGFGDVWKTKNLSELQELWKSLEFRWQLPIVPTTATPSPRRSNSKFYQSQTLKGTLDQDFNRLGENLEFIEVVRFGTAVSKYDNEQLFAGTYYWPVRGSGLFLPVGKILFAYNKIHAFRLLGCSYEEIVYSFRPNFIAFLKNEATVFWSKVIADMPTASRDDYFKDFCVWNTGTSDAQCPVLFDIGMTKINLCTKVVYRFIDDFCSGSTSRKFSDTQSPLSFFDQDPFLDRMIAQVAAQRGFDTCVFIKQVGFDTAQELLHCKDPVTSLMMLQKFTPFDERFTRVNSVKQDTVNFYVSKNIPRVQPECISQIPYRPFVDVASCVIPPVLIRKLGDDIKF